MSLYRQALFSRVVPTVKRIGLWGQKIQDAFVDLGVIGLAEAEPAEMFANDERIADELEAAIAARRQRDPETPGDPPASRAEELAEAIISGDTPGPPAISAE
jgi:hypothetical protein